MQLILKSNNAADIYLLKGINAFYINDVQTVYHSFRKAYQEYNKIEMSYFWVKRELMKENIITAYTILNINESSYDVSFLTFDCKEQLLASQNAVHEARGIIRTKDKLLNFPLVI